jgi:feruloyl esterase
MKFLLVALIVLFPTLAHGAPGSSSCTDLAHLTYPQGTVTSAAVVPAGDFRPAASTKLSGLPAFCRVLVRLTPTADSDIHTEVWLPMEQWNGKLLAVGSGGWGGTIAYSSLAEALLRHYATTATDEGHTVSTGAFAVHHPEKFIDFAYRSEHEMTVHAKLILAAFYGKPAGIAYWNGCSGGGREGLQLAHRYPEDFNGIIAGDPATFRRNTWALSLAKKSLIDPATFIPAEKYPMVHQAVLNACDALDGLQDGLIDDPRACRFDPAVRQCTGADNASCLTAPQVKTARAVLSPVTTSDGTQVFPRLTPGTELRWGRLIGGPEPADLFEDYFRYVLHQDPGWRWRNFDLDRDAALAARSAALIEPDPDLRAFTAGGGKLLLYQGWADQQVAPEAVIEYFDAVRTTPVDRSSSVRLFMAPGMAHCSGGEGPNVFDKIDVLERWNEQGIAPDRIVAVHKTNGKEDRSRPLCPYPQVARYNGKGSIDADTSFTCQAPGSKP